MLVARRHFLALCAASGLRAQLADLTDEKLRLASPSASTPWDFRVGDAAEYCARLGYEAIEITLNEGFPTEPESSDAATASLSCATSTSACRP
ncbi:MAG: hypothetical protein R2724_02280 [Bryobacterales bacterium]